MKVLVTGFEPFDGACANPSARVVEALHGPGVAGAVLPVRCQGLPELVQELLSVHDPDLWLCLGESREQPALRVERLAVNLLDFDIPDDQGVEHLEQPVVAGGPEGYWVTVAARAWRDSIRSQGVPAVLSVGAGSYLCNQLLYLALHAGAQRSGRPRVGFLHLPSLPEQMALQRQPRATMDLATSLKAVRAVLDWERQNS